MTDLISAIQDKFLADDWLVRQIAGGLWVFQADNPTPTPMVILTPIGTGSVGRNTGEDYTVIESMQISVYAAKIKDAEGLARAFVDRIFKPRLMMDSGYVMDYELTGERLMKDRTPEVNGAPVYHFSIDYDFKIQRNK